MSTNKSRAWIYFRECGSTLDGDTLDANTKVYEMITFPPFFQVETAVIQETGRTNLVNALHLLSARFRPFRFYSNQLFQMVLFPTLYTFLFYLQKFEASCSLTITLVLKT